MPLVRIQKIKAREVLDSKGNPTVEVDLETEQGVFRASVPSWGARGKYEVLELRDGGKRYSGMGVLKAVENVNDIIGPALKGKDPTKQKEIDDLMIELDGTEQKSNLGANAILAVSIAVCRAGAAAKEIPLYEHIAQLAYNNFPTAVKKLLRLPRPCVLMIEGGRHAGNELDFQEFMIVPQVEPFSKALEAASQISSRLKEILIKNLGKRAINVGDEGGFAPSLRFPEQALEFILEAIKQSGYEKKTRIILDVAASHFFSEGKYQMGIGVFTREGLLNYYATLLGKYSIIGLEDPFNQEDWQGFSLINKKFGKQVLIIGDDLLVTNPQRIKKAIEEKACNGAIIKPNQIGTVTETIEAVKLAREAGFKIFIKHRGGETNDDFIADLAIGLGADYIMAGALARGERIAKYNRLLRIEEELR